MLFNSLLFAVFLTVVFILYHIVPVRFRWAFLLLASYVFYMNLHVAYGFLLLFLRCSPTVWPCDLKRLLKKRKRDSA